MENDGDHEKHEAELKAEAGNAGEKIVTAPVPPTFESSEKAQAPLSDKNQEKGLVPEKNDTETSVDKEKALIDI